MSDDKGETLLYMEDKTLLCLLESGPAEQFAEVSRPI